MNVGRALLGGAVGTAAMTMLMLAAPMMGMPEMPIGEMLGSFLGIGSAYGARLPVVAAVRGAAA